MKVKNINTNILKELLHKMPEYETQIKNKYPKWERNSN